VLWGRHDRIYPVPIAHRLVREIPGAKLHIMDAGHVPHEERSREFLALLTEFLEGKRG
jgi:pimeloyl-ACP methyl ester carboxylesterase